MKSGITDTTTPEPTVVEIPHMTSILRFTMPRDLGRVAQVNRSFRAAADSIVVWQEMINRYFPYLLKQDERVHTHPKALFIEKLQSVLAKDASKFLKMHNLTEVLPNKALVLSSLRGEERLQANKDFLSTSFQKLLFILALANGHLLATLEYEDANDHLNYALGIAAKNGCSQGVKLILERQFELDRGVLKGAVYAASKNRDTTACEMLIPLLSQEEKEDLFTDDDGKVDALDLLLLNNTKFENELLLRSLEDKSEPLVIKNIVSRMENCSNETLQALLLRYAEYTAQTDASQQESLRTILRMPNLQFTAEMIGEALVRVIDTFHRGNEVERGDRVYNSFPPDGMIRALSLHPESKNSPRALYCRVLVAAITAGLSILFKSMMNYTVHKPIKQLEILSFIIAAVSSKNMVIIQDLLPHCAAGMFQINHNNAVAELILHQAAREDYEDIVDTLLTKHSLSLNPAVIGEALGIAALNRSQRVVECILRNDLNEITEVQLNVALGHTTKNQDKVMTTALLAKLEAMSGELFKEGEIKSKRPRIN